MKDYKDTRIGKLRDYLFNVIEQIRNVNQINANFLSNTIDNYSLDKIPTERKLVPYIIGGGIYQETYSFRGRLPYGQDFETNLKTMGFFEEFEDIIESNNNKGIKPDIDGIESIECLDRGTLNNAETKTGEFDVQIRITFYDDGNHQPIEPIISL